MPSWGFTGGVTIEFLGTVVSLQLNGFGTQCIGEVDLEYY